MLPVIVPITSTIGNFLSSENGSALEFITEKFIILDTKIKKSRMNFMFEFIIGKTLLLLLLFFFFIKKNFLVF